MLSQKERINAELSALSINVTEEDRKEFMKEFKFRSPTTVSEYLNGKVGSVNTGLKMLVFFKKKIEEREEILSSLNPA